jgi:hypothetical protein
VKPATLLQGQKLPSQTHKWRLLAQAPVIDSKGGRLWTIDLSQWIAGNPVDVLATNFSKPAALFEKFPRQDVIISSKDGS